MHYRILIGIERYQTSSSGIVQTDFDIGVSQTIAEIIESDCDEVSFAPIVYKSFGAVIVILQRSGDSPLRDFQSVLNVRNGSPPITT